MNRVNSTDMIVPDKKKSTDYESGLVAFSD